MMRTGKIKRKGKHPTLGQILNPQYIRHLEAVEGETGSGTTSIGGPESKRRKREIMKNNNTNMDAILSTSESTQVGLCSAKVLEVKSGETVLAKHASSDANMVSKGDYSEVANGKIGENETGSGTTSIHNPASRKQERHNVNKNPDLGDILSTHESTQEELNATKVLKVKSGVMVLGKAATSDVNMVSKGDHTKVTSGKIRESETINCKVSGQIKQKRWKTKKPTLGQILNERYLLPLEAAEYQSYSFTTVLRKQKMQKLNKNPNVGDSLSIREGIQEGLTTTKVIEVQSGETVSGKTATSNANMTSKGIDHADGATIIEVQNGEMGSGKTATANANMVPKGVDHTEGATSFEAQKAETISGKTATSNANMMSKGVNHIEGATSIEVQNGETVSGKSATSYANMVSKGVDRTEGITNKMQENETNNLNVNGKRKKRERPKSKNKGSTLDESMRYLNNLEAAKHDTGSGTTATDNPTSKKQKRQEINYNPALGDMLSTCDNTQYRAIANKNLSTSKVLEAANGEKVSRGEEHMKDACNSETGFTTIIRKSTEQADLEIVEAKANSALTRKSQTLWVKEITQVATPVKKLLIFDVNGLLADVVSPQPKGIRADYYMLGGKAVFKRPYLDDFLCFCFERFNVGIWSSRKMKTLRPLVRFLLGDLKMKLIFTWDGSKCTNSGVKTLEVKHKCVVAKDLRKVWYIDGFCNRWVKGTFHESNTLLVDDSPYKGLLNPKHTGIFPASYKYTNKDDNFLGPKGELQTYLEGLAAADDVKTYVEQHPFGQSAIDEQSPNWAFYSHVLERLNWSNLLARRDLQNCQLYRNKHIKDLW
ncbi:hypothetical protein R6Q57_001240 [Mikania cordata]